MKTIEEKLLSKKGSASIFVVVFTIIILSIIVLGFTRLVVSEATKTMNTDLSQSAYDSALAGVEDAKIALLKYHACLDQGYTPKENGNDCEKIIYNMQKGIAEEDCSTVQKVLSREAKEETENAVVVQETQESSDAGNNTNMMQKYTCVTIKEELSDYRTTLNNENRLRIIPIRPAHEDTEEIDTIHLQWFSSVNLSKTSSKFCPNYLYPFRGCPDGATGDQAPTTLVARLIQTDYDFDLSELTVAKGDNNTNTAQMMFIPTRSGNGTNSISGIGESANKGENDPVLVNCDVNKDWLCSVDIKVPKTFRGDRRHPSNTYLLVSIPYGSPETDISLSIDAKIQRPGESGKVTTHVSFNGVQARIDSTGRANDLYRRVETRVELVDTYFPYPEFEITMTGGESDILSKTFYVTKNCIKLDNGYGGRCSDNVIDVGFSR